MSVIRSLENMEPQKTKVYDTYWRFACERQNIFMRKFMGGEDNLTSDPILMEYKFTNAYRASDRTSQYLIRNVIYNGPYSPEDTLFRILLFKTFNRIETWQRLELAVGDISLNTFNKDVYGKVLGDYYSNGIQLYSGAYIMASGKTAFGFDRKYMNHLSLIEHMMRDHISLKIAKCSSLEELYTVLLQYPTIGAFLAYQYAIDINYSELVDFDEMEFVVAGPGAKAGIRKCFSNFSKFTDSYLIRYMCENQAEEFARLDLPFQTLWGRKLQLIDCQNIFCETDKYSRAKHPDVKDKSARTRIKQKYKKKANRIDFFYPPKWNINDKLQAGGIVMG